MKIHFSLAKAVVDNVTEIFFDNKYADKVIEKCFKFQKNRGSSDRAFIAENTYGIVRYWRLLVYCNDTTENISKVNVWHVLATWFLLQKIEVPNWDTLEGFDRQKVIKNFEEAEKNINIVESYPDWLSNYVTSELDSKIWQKNMLAMNIEAPVCLRVNTLKIKQNILIKNFEEKQIAVEKTGLSQDGLILTKRKNLFTTEEFKNGWFEIQDIGSQLIGHYLDVKPGMRVIDACAGAGGKTLHLASIMQNKGSIIAMDLEEWKLEELKKRARRAGVSIIQTKLIEGTKTIKRLEESCDRLLLDVPCSGLGVIRRNPDAKWKLNSEFINRVKEEQSKILASYTKMLKPGGKLVYATCSILPSENEKQVEKFISNSHGLFEIEAYQTLYPSESNTDGFFMARILKK